MNDCNRDVHEPCSRSIQAARAAGNVDTDELMRRPEKASARSRDSLLVATPRRQCLRRLGSRTALLWHQRYVRQLLRAYGDRRVEFPPTRLNCLLFDFGKPSTLMSW